MTEQLDPDYPAPELLAKDRKRYPLYAAWERRGQQDKFLTVDELETQTDEFMRSFQPGVEKGELPDSIFFLDKSARPLAFLMRKLWDKYYPEIQMPDVRYINIGGSGSRLYDKDSRPFTGDPKIIADIYGEHIKADGRIMIVDEYTHKGEAIGRAKDTITQAFPEADVTARAAFSKLPNWYQNSDYLGVEEYSEYDFEKMALEQINQEFNTNYTDLWRYRLGRNTDLDGSIQEGVDYDNIPLEIRRRFHEIVNEKAGTIPYVKRGEQERTEYREVKPSALERLKNLVTGRVPERKLEAHQVNRFKEAREELARMADEIVRRYVHPNQ